MASNSAVLDHTGKLRASVISAHGEVSRAEKNIPVTFNGADRHCSLRVLADVQVAIAEKLHARGATLRVIVKLNRTGPAAVLARAGNQRGITCGWAEARGAGVEEGKASICATKGAAIVDDSGIVCARCVEKRREASGRLADFGAVVDKSRIPCGRTTAEFCETLE